MTEVAGGALETRWIRVVIAGHAVFHVAFIRNAGAILNEVVAGIAQATRVAVDVRSKIACTAVSDGADVAPVRVVDSANRQRPRDGRRFRRSARRCLHTLTAQ